jgi:hypothetical protein
MFTLTSGAWSYERSSYQAHCATPTGAYCRTASHQRLSERKLRAEGAAP